MTISPSKIIGDNSISTNGEIEQFLNNYIDGIYDLRTEINKYI